MDIRCEAWAFCCRHINFKILFHSISEHAISFKKLKNFLGRGHNGRGHSPLSAPTAPRLVSSALNLWPPHTLQNPKYATKTAGK